MRLFRLPFWIAIAVLSFSQFFAPAASRADTYQIVGLGSDNLQFYGMDDSGHVVLFATFFSCGDPSQGCYEDFLNGTPVGRTGVAPAFAWDYTVGTCASPPCTISNNGRTAIIAVESTGQDGLFVDSGSNPPELLLIAGLNGSKFAMNGLGDIVFDDGLLDEWDEAIDLSTVPIPEPTSVLLLGTGAITLAGMAPRRKRAA